MLAVDIPLMVYITMIFQPPTSQFYVVVLPRFVDVLVKTAQPPLQKGFTGEGCLDFSVKVECTKIGRETLIAYVKGELAFVDDRSVVVDVGGVGYLVNVSPATVSRLPSRGSDVQIFTYFQSGESGQALHGFLTQEEVRLFTLLISVSGIGPKVASAILGAMSPQQIILAIVAEDAVALSKAPGVGKKTAQRVMLELKDKIKSATGEESSYSSTSIVNTSSGAKQDAIDALLALGYGRAESVQAVLEVAVDDEMSADVIIKLALKKLAEAGAF